MMPSGFDGDNGQQQQQQQQQDEGIAGGRIPEMRVVLVSDPNHPGTRVCFHQAGDDPNPVARDHSRIFLEFPLVLDGRGVWLSEGDVVGGLFLEKVDEYAQELGLPSAPPQPIVYLTEANRPQPLLDVNRDGGLTISVGRLRPCSVFDYKFVALGHNTIRGAAGAAILNAELMHREGLL